MKKLFIFLLGLLVIALLAYYCIYNKNTPLTIQQDISNRSQVALNNANMQWAKVEVDGRDITLTGIAPDQTSIDNAKDIAAVKGYRIIDNQLRLANATTTPSALPDYELLMSKSEDGKITLDGVLDKYSHEVILNTAQQQYGVENVVDNIQISNTKKIDFITSSFPFVTQQLAQLKTGTARYSQNNLQFDGMMLAGATVDDFKQQTKQTLSDKIKVDFQLAEAEKSPPPVVDLKPKVSPNTPPVTPSKTSKKLANNCQANFNRALSTPIRFQSSSTKIKKSSYKTLNKIVKIAKKCKDFSLIVHGHTDSLGNKKLNKKLSLGRANSVVKYLIAHHINGKRLNALGHGASAPIASNKTAIGRAKNRRIEITIKDK